VGPASPDPSAPQEAILYPFAIARATRFRLAGAGGAQHKWGRRQGVRGGTKRDLSEPRGDWRGKTAGPRNVFPFSPHFLLDAGMSAAVEDLLPLVASRPGQQSCPGHPGDPAGPREQRRGHIFILRVALRRAFGRRACEEGIAELFNSAILLRPQPQEAWPRACCQRRTSGAAEPRGPLVASRSGQQSCPGHRATGARIGSRRAQRPSAMPRRSVRPARGGILAQKILLFGMGRI